MLQILSTSNETSTGPELVKNGNFSEVGSELVTNGNFSATGSELVTSWTNSDFTSFTSSGSDITQMVSSGSGQNCYSAATFTSGKSYKLQFTSSQALSPADCQVRISSSTNLTGEQLVFNELASGLNEVYFVANSNYNYIGFYGVSAFSDTQITNFTVKELGEDWTLGTGWSIGANKASANGAGSNGQGIEQQVFEVGKNYKLTFNLTNYTAGDVRLVGGKPFAIETTYNSNGSYTVYGKAEVNNLRFYSNNFNGSIENVSVKELGKDWSVGSGWSIGEDKAIASPATDYLYQADVYDKNTIKTYKLTYTITVDSGKFVVFINGKTGSTFFGDETDNGTYTHYFTTTGIDGNGDGRLYFTALEDFDGSLTNVSVKLLGTYDDQSIYVTAADVQTIAQASVYYLVELTSMASKNSLYFLPSSVVANNGRYTKLNFTVISKDVTPTPASGIISFYDSVGGFDTYPMGFYEFRIYEQTSSTNLNPTLATGLLEKGFAFVRDFSGNMQELTDGFKEYNPTLTQYVYSK